MKDNTRRAIAYVALRAAGKTGSSVFDYSVSSHFNFTGSVEEGRVSIFDYTSGCHITGNLPSLFHYGNGTHLSLKLDEGRFSGFDYGTSSHFSGTFSESRVSLFDYSTSTYFNYS